MVSLKLVFPEPFSRYCDDNIVSSTPVEQFGETQKEAAKSKQKAKGILQHKVIHFVSVIPNLI